MAQDCLQKEEGFVHCMRHPHESCKLVFCMDCGRDLYRECESEVE